MLKPQRETGMRTKNIHHPVFLVFLFISFLINGCAGDDSSQWEPLRRIDLEGQKNFRDLGGYKNVYGESVRWRILFRSGDLCALTDNDLLIVNSLDLQLVIDFRSEEEVDACPDRSPAGARILHDPITIEGFQEFLFYVLETGDTSHLTVSNIASLYESVYTDNMEQFEVMLSEVINSENRPVLIHCRGGADRTGFGAALILSSLQVPDEIIFQDYLLSNAYRRDITEESLDFVKEAIQQNTGQAPTEEDMERIRNLFEARQAYMDIALQNVVDTYGTFEEYIVSGLGIPMYEIEEFRRSVLVPLYYGGDF
jgi:protein-tyrosine phosphatase